MSENTIVHVTVSKLVYGKRSVLTPLLAPAIPSEASRGFIQSPLANSKGRTQRANLYLGSVQF